MRKEEPWVLALACWLLATFDTPLKDRRLPLSQLLSSGPACSTSRATVLDNYRKPAGRGIYEPRESLTLEGGGRCEESLVTTTIGYVLFPVQAGGRATMPTFPSLSQAFYPSSSCLHLPLCISSTLANCSLHLPILCPICCLLH